MNTNDPGGSRTRDLRIKSHQHQSNAGNDLGDSPSDSGAVRDRGGPSSSGLSATNPITSQQLVDTPESDLRNALQVIECGSVSLKRGDVYSLTSKEIREIKFRLESALARLAVERAARREALKHVLRQRRAQSPTPALTAELELIDRTNAEIAAGPNAIMEELVRESR